MNRREKAMAWAFALVMLLFSLSLALWIPFRARLDFQLADTLLSLETSQGREKKQQMEYDAVMEKLPKARAELAETQPLAEEAAEEVTKLKETRKELRARKKAMEKEASEKGKTDQEAETSAVSQDGEAENP